jgi:hypothetical protein
MGNRSDELKSDPERGDWVNIAKLTSSTHNIQQLMLSMAQHIVGLMR